VPKVPKEHWSNEVYDNGMRSLSVMNRSAANSMVTSCEDSKHGSCWKCYCPIRPTGTW